MSLGLLLPEAVGYVTVVAISTVLFSTRRDVEYVVITDVTIAHNAEVFVKR